MYQNGLDNKRNEDRHTDTAARDEKRDQAVDGNFNPPFHARSGMLRRLLLILDLATVTLAFMLTLLFVPAIWPENGINRTDHYGLLPIIVVTFVVCRNLLGRKLSLGRATVLLQVISLFREVAVTVAVIVILIFMLNLTFVSRLVVGWFAVTSVALLVSSRLIIYWYYFLHSKNVIDQALNVLIIGSGRRAQILVKRLQESFEWNVNIVGFLDPKGKSMGRREGDEILGHVDQIATVLRDHVIEEVIVAVPRSMLGDVQTIVDSCQEEGVRLLFMVDLYDIQAQKIHLAVAGDIPLLGFEFVSREHNALIAKRIFDIVVTLAAMPLMLPILLITALAIRLDSKGPVLFVQNRVGLHKKHFPMFKFRSMVVDAEERMKDIEHLNEAEGANFKIKNDPRITRVGRFIRKMSIDELPQLINVLRGDMSLVGPRPMSIRDVSQFDKGIQRKRFSVRPGITGLWQVSGRSNLSFDRWIELDLDYINRWSFSLDVKILLKTIPVVLLSRGAV
jgi:exopolysaccharide biosynthesis polyprenyl glycosylphosphotransferase